MGHELVQLGYSSSYYINTKRGLNLHSSSYPDIKKFEDITYYMDFYYDFVDILDQLQDDYKELKKMARYKEIYNDFIDNQVETFKEYIDREKDIDLC